MCMHNMNTETHEPLNSTQSLLQSVAKARRHRNNSRAIECLNGDRPAREFRDESSWFTEELKKL